MGRIVAYCGIVCSECPAYITTQNGDVAARQKLAAEWSKQFNSTITPDDCICDGCLATTRLGSYCRTCEIRACGVERAVVNCAHCDDYGCEKLEGFWVQAPDARKVLEGIRAGL